MQPAYDGEIRGVSDMVQHGLLATICRYHLEKNATQMAAISWRGGYLELVPPAACVACVRRERSRLRIDAVPLCAHIAAIAVVATVKNCEVIAAALDAHGRGFANIGLECLDVGIVRGHLVAEAGAEGQNQRLPTHLLSLSTPKHAR